MQLAWFVLGVVVIVLTWIYCFQERMIYFPTQSFVALPSDAGLAHEDVWLQTADGVRLHGWFVPCVESRGTVLFCHGNAGNISQRIETLVILNGLGFNVLIFDYRGYGRSQGRPSEQGTYLDGAAAWDHLLSVRGEPPERIVLLGRSLGGGIASWLAAYNSPAALILESTFTSVTDVGQRLYPFLPRFLSRVRYDTLGRLGMVRCPLLVAHSPDDEVVSQDFGLRLYVAYKGSKRYLPLCGGHDRGFLETGALYVEQLNVFLTDMAGL